METATIFKTKAEELTNEIMAQVKIGEQYKVVWYGRKQSKRRKSI